MPRSSIASNLVRSAHRPFECQFCKRRFHRLEHQQRHERLHTKESPFKCQLCNQSFTRKDVLTRHENLSHANGVKGQVLGLHCDSRVTKKCAPHRQTKGARSITGRIGVVEQYPQQSFYDSLWAFPALEDSELYLTEPSATTSSKGQNSTEIQYSLTAQPGSHIINASANQDDDISSNLNADAAATERISEHTHPLPFGDLQLNFSFPWDSVFNGPDTIELYGPGLDNSRSTPALEDASLNAMSRDTMGAQSSRSVLSRDFHLFTTAKNFWDVSKKEEQYLSQELESFGSVVPFDFVLPSHQALSRYLFRYLKDFHEHLPFIHTATFNIQKTRPELVLALAAVGGIYCHDDPRAVSLFQTSKALALERIREDKERAHHRFSMTEPQQGSARIPQDRAGTLQTAQTLLILLITASWSDPQFIFQESLALQSILNAYLREMCLLDSGPSDGSVWEQWIVDEGTKRTVYISFCLFNFHMLLSNLPPAILNRELCFTLPCNENVWRCSTAADWQRVQISSATLPEFQAALSNLLSGTADTEQNPGSVLGSYILILALIQHIFFVRQLESCTPGFDGTLPEDTSLKLTKALERWQHMWEQTPESCFDPQDLNGPVAFNSTALLRIAYVQINLDIGPGRLLAYLDPNSIARAMLQCPPVRRSNQMTQAALHCAHALELLTKLGFEFMTQKRAYTWSLQHAISALQCTVLLVKWLETVTIEPVEPPLSHHEQRLLTFIKDTLKELDLPDLWRNDEFGYTNSGKLGAYVARIWARMFSGDHAWDIVTRIGKALEIYGNRLTPSL